MLSNKIDTIFIIHYTPLVERKNYIINFFNQHNINNYEFRSLYQREELTEDIKNKYFKLDNLNNALISITIEHIETYRKIIETCRDENKWYLILEDDSIFCEDFINKLNFYMENIPIDAEYLDINNYSTINDRSELWIPHKGTRTTCSYLIKKSTCEKLLPTIIPFNMAIDHELNTQMKIHDLKTYWSNSHIINH